MLGGFRRKMVRAARLTVYCIYLSKKKKIYIYIYIFAIVFSFSVFVFENGREKGGWDCFPNQ